MNQDSAASASTEASAPSNRRRAARHKSLMAGEIMLRDETARHACDIRNMSGTGALLKVRDGVVVPNEFTLVVRRDGRHIPAKVMWRARETVGVHFTGPETIR